MATRNVPKGDTPEKTAPVFHEAPLPNLTWWHEPTATARNALSILIYAAFDLDLPDEDSDSNYALRLLGMAAKVVDDDMVTDDLLQAENPQNDVANACFNCIALLRATLVHPDGSFDIRRRTWVSHALSILDVLVDLHMNGAKGTEYVLTLENKIKQFSPQPPSTEPPKRTSVQSSQVITRDTELVKAGNIALDIVAQATYDIEPISIALLDLANDLEVEHSGLLRCYALRIKQLNSILMSYLNDDSITVDSAHSKVWGHRFELPEGAPA